MQDLEIITFKMHLSDILFLTKKHFLHHPILLTTNKEKHQSGKITGSDSVSDGRWDLCLTLLCLEESEEHMEGKESGGAETVPQVADCFLFVFSIMIVPKFFMPAKDYVDNITFKNTSYRTMWQMKKLLIISLCFTNVFFLFDSDETE